MLRHELRCVVMTNLIGAHERVWHRFGTAIGRVGTQ